ncbi:MAG: hypothetical protein F4X80_02970 [Chloroflexi bacterium]|nr:hypothetical protein [Chloroflexota bacterium]MYE31626.1 hypothetical protein [Chloroflexota bacterium]
MRTRVATTDVDGATAPPVRPEHIERIEAAAAEVLSANTPRADATAWCARSVWCSSEGVEPMPAQPVLIAAYPAERGEAWADISTLCTASAIACERGAPSAAVDPRVRRIARWHASEGRTPQEAAALTAEALAAIRATAHRSRTSPGGRTESAERARRRGEPGFAIATVMLDPCCAAPRRPCSRGRASRARLKRDRTRDPRSGSRARHR